jgi:hypothetical protein
MFILRWLAKVGGTGARGIASRSPTMRWPGLVCVGVGVATAMFVSRVDHFENVILNLLWLECCRIWPVSWWSGSTATEIG